MPEEVALADFAHPLIQWYAASHRDLPWRTDPTPYRVWVSEIMLQQTRVEAVKPYFARFTEALPDVHALAACDPERLNKLWEGLGYYSRVRNMQKAAQTIVKEFGGVIPSDPKTLLTLSGIGSYTAGAIASFAFGVPAPAVDGNVLRVLARVTGDKRNILDPQVKRDYEAAILKVIPKDTPGDYNQALIEVGATVCGPNLPPDCGACPLAHVCRAHKENKTDVIPYRAKKKPRRHENKTVLVIRDGAHTLIHRRLRSGLLAGLYEFPMIDQLSDEAEVLAYVRTLGLEPLRIASLPAVKHVFTHIEWHMTGYLITVADAALPANSPLSFSEDAPEKQGFAPMLSPTLDGDYVFADVLGLTDTYAIPSAHGAYLKTLSIEKGSRRIKHKKT